MTCDNLKASSEIEHVDWSTGSATQCNNARCGSQSSQVSQNSGDICRICHCESDPQNPLLTPCYCSGSLKYVHQTCLQQWLTASETNFCELCKFPFIMHTKIKPLHEWRSLDISGIERRRLCCSALFHCAAALCVIWSLCVLIERAADDVQRGLIDWPFWTKLAVVTVGLTGGVIFMYIQCKAYLHLCHRWKARNRILLIQNAPEKISTFPPTSPRPAQQQNSDRNNEACTSGGHRSLGADAIERLVNESNSNSRNMVCMSQGNANAAALDATDSLGDKMQETDSLYRHERVPYNQHLLQDLENDVDSLIAATTRSSSSNLYRVNASTGCGSGVSVPGPHHVGQVAVSANIECSQSQHNYDRDWALDDVVSQISSFRPCPQGSGSMTPFHDSIHNVLEHNSDTSSCVSVNEVDNGDDSDNLALECKGASAPVCGKHTPISFDATTVSEAGILDSSVNTRSAAVGGSLGSSDIDGFLQPQNSREQHKIYLGHDVLNTNSRRHSDTKLLEDDVQHQPMFVDMNENRTYDNGQDCRLLVQPNTIPTRTRGGATAASAAVRIDDSTVVDMDMLSVLQSPPNMVYNMQGFQLLPTNALKMPSDKDAAAYKREQQLQWQQQEINRGRRMFKSLPNLSSSNENLLKK